MRSKKFDDIAVDELDTMHLEADLNDAFVSADAASKNNKNATRSTCPSQLPWGKGSWMTEVRDAVMRRWLTSDIHESGDQGSRMVIGRAWGSRPCFFGTP